VGEVDPTAGRVEECQQAGAVDGVTSGRGASDRAAEGAQEAERSADGFADAHAERFDGELVDEPYEVPEPPLTGDAVVDEVARRVAVAAQQPLDVQVGVYDAVHRALQDRLADVED
jgi:hypothetical protein